MDGGLVVSAVLFFQNNEAAMNSEGKVGWEEIVDSRLEGKFNVQELNDVAALAYKCIDRSPKKRPSMRDIVQVLSRILKLMHDRKHHRRAISATIEEVTIDIEQADYRSPMSEKHRRMESVESMADSYDA